MRDNWRRRSHRASMPPQLYRACSSQILTYKDCKTRFDKSLLIKEETVMIKWGTNYLLITQRFANPKDFESTMRCISRGEDGIVIYNLETSADITITSEGIIARRSEVTIIKPWFMSGSIYLSVHDLPEWKRRQIFDEASAQKFHLIFRIFGPNWNLEKEIRRILPTETTELIYGALRQQCLVGISDFAIEDGWENFEDSYRRIEARGDFDGYLTYLERFEIGSVGTPADPEETVEVGEDQGVGEKAAA